VTSGDTKWRVLRQDDHGNRFVVAEGLSRAEAEARVAELAARAHKQTYWCEASPETS
jgi:hypothetical protein